MPRNIFAGDDNGIGNQSQYYSISTSCTIARGMKVESVEMPHNSFIVTSITGNRICGVMDNGAPVSVNAENIVKIIRRFDIDDTVYLNGGLGPNRPTFQDQNVTYEPGEARRYTGQPLLITAIVGIASYKVRAPDASIFVINDSWINIGRSLDCVPIEDTIGSETDNQSNTQTIDGVRFACMNEAVDGQTVQKYIHYFKTNLIIGTELEKHNDYDDDVSSHVDQRLDSRLLPTHSYSELGEYGVYKIESDGSICGREVLVIGTNENFASWHERMTKVHEVLEDLKYYAERDCGMHYHLLCPQRQRVPQVIMKNYIQLLRKYADALIWITSAQTKPGMNRGLNEYSKWSSMMKRTPTRRTLRKYRDWIMENANGGHYEAVNICQRGYFADHQQLFGFDREGNMTNWHIELRFPDANDSPAVICAIGNLFRAMLIKAVEMSEYGVLTVDSDGDQWRETKDRVGRMSNGLPVAVVDQSVCKVKAKELISLVKNALLSFDGDSIRVLTRLAEKPTSVLRSIGKDWDEIERYYLPPTALRETPKMKRLRQAIALQVVTRCESVREWETKMANHLGISSWETLRRQLYNLKEIRNIVWDKSVGAYLLVY